MYNNGDNGQSIDHERLKIDIGVNLQIQIGQLPGRMDSTLIGICPDRYMILSMPRGTEQALTPLHDEGVPLIIRYLHHGVVYGFRSALLHALARPERLLFISYPVQVEVYELRHYPRIACFLPARATINHQLFEGSVLNVSRNGARFSFAADTTTMALVGRIDADLELDVQFPGAQNYTHILGNLRDVHASSDRMNLGIRFDRIEGPQLADLLSFLLDAQALPEHHGLASVIRKHALWRRAVSMFFHAVDDAKPAFVLSADECEMGKWLSRTGKDQYGKTEEFRQLEQTHHRLHEEVMKAVRLRQDGDKEGALALFNKIDVERLSHRISALLLAADEHRLDVAMPAAAENASAAVVPAGIETLPTAEPQTAGDPGG